MKVPPVWTILNTYLGITYNTRALPEDEVSQIHASVAALHDELQAILNRAAQEPTIEDGVVELFFLLANHYLFEYNNSRMAYKAMHIMLIENGFRLRSQQDDYFADEEFEQTFFHLDEITSEQVLEWVKARMEPHEIITDYTSIFDDD